MANPMDGTSRIRVKGFASNDVTILFFAGAAQNERESCSRNLRPLPSVLRLAPVKQRVNRPYGAVVGVLQTILQIIYDTAIVLGKE